METMNKIYCPNCDKWILFAIDNSMKYGKIESVCKYCRTKSVYDIQTQKFEIRQNKLTTK